MAERLKLGEILVRAGLLTQEQLEMVLERQEAEVPRLRLGRILEKLGLATEVDVARAVAEQFGLPLFDPEAFEPSESLGLVSRQFAERHLLVAVARSDDGGLVVAMADPTNVLAIDDLRVTTGVRSIRPVVATPTAVLEAIRRSYGLETQSVSALLKERNLVESDVQTESVPGGDAEEDLDEVYSETEMAPVVQLMNSIMADAATAGATDIHIEPQTDDLRVRYRVDGVLREVLVLPVWLRPALLSRLKIVAGMDIAERRRPQDGRARVVVRGNPLDVRVSTIPALHGEKAVIRLLPEASGAIELAKLGFAPDQLGPMERNIEKPQGLILFTGPTGSGKTTSMYAVLQRLASPQRNVTTLEDPVEYQMQGVNQVQMDEKTGMTFAAGLRTVLRQDPDVVLVGEIRDAETARICVQAAMTGHMVLSTLHTNDAASAVTRLVDIGLEPFLVASALSLVVAQRLLRRICGECAEPAEPSERTLRLLGLSKESVGDAAFMVGRGCSSCGNTGYRGRIGVYEVLEVTASLRERISAGATPAVITVAARAQGMRTLREVALENARAGRTTLEEVLRGTHFDREELRHCSGCGREVQLQFVACPYCLSPLTQRACPSCKRPVEPDWRGCPYCKAPLVAAAPSSGLGGPERAAGSLPRLLLVEDDRTTARIVHSALESAYEVRLAATGREAIEAATSLVPDLVVLDLGLPDMSGTEVVRRIRQSPAVKDVPVMVLTAADTRETEMECLEAGVDDFLGKPVYEGVLRARLAALLRRSVRTSPTP